jgi:hypothetical protein
MKKIIIVALLATLISSCKKESTEVKNQPIEVRIDIENNDGTIDPLLIMKVN